jgi:hypothetical protein
MLTEERVNDGGVLSEKGLRRAYTTSGRVLVRRPIDNEQEFIPTNIEAESSTTSIIGRKQNIPLQRSQTLPVKNQQKSFSTRDFELGMKDNRFPAAIEVQLTSGSEEKEIRFPSPVEVSPTIYKRVSLPPANENLAAGEISPAEESQSTLDSASVVEEPESQLFSEPENVLESRDAESSQATAEFSVANLSLKVLVALADSGNCEDETLNQKILNAALEVQDSYRDKDIEVWALAMKAAAVMNPGFIDTYILVK